MYIFQFVGPSNSTKIELYKCLMFKLVSLVIVAPYNTPQTKNELSNFEKLAAKQ